MHLIPSVKVLETKNGALKKNAICYEAGTYEARLELALQKLPYDAQGAKFDIHITGGDGEGYELRIQEDSICIDAQSERAAFYAIQTLRQIFKHGEIPCLYIKDEPSFAYRGFYHDVTRGKVPTVETIKKLIDELAYYKTNSFQLYIEHTFEFDECKELIHKTGYLTKEEIKEIGEYCEQNYMEFIPSIATFGHMYEILQQEQYQHLRVLKDYEEQPNFWWERMEHHTIDPLNPDSIKLIKSLIDQYYPLFKSDIFNICCDETFDLKVYEKDGYDAGQLYVDFVKQIIAHLKQNGKKIMMWADILLQHPETITELPEDTIFLNWDYTMEPPEEKIMKFKELGRKQIVCPGTVTWSRMCEDVQTSEPNIIRMVEYGYKHGAVGVLNTSWGDCGNPCSLELGMFGLALGAEKSWSAESKIDHDFYDAVNALVYESDKGVELITELSAMQNKIDVLKFWQQCFDYQSGNKQDICPISKQDVEIIQEKCAEIMKALAQEKSLREDIREEMFVTAEGIILWAELSAKMSGFSIDRITNAERWLVKYRKLWTDKNKENELGNIENLLLYCEQN